MVHQVRHPLRVVSSLLGIGLFRMSLQRPARALIEQHLGPLTGSEIEKAMEFWCRWQTMLEAIPGDTLYRVEDLTEDHSLLTHFFGSVRPRGTAIPSDYNTRDRGPLLNWSSLPAGQSRTRMQEVAAAWGYE